MVLENLQTHWALQWSDYGSSLALPPLYIAKGYCPESISVGKRIGIDNAGEARDYPWRFWVTNNKYVSRHQKSEYVVHLNQKEHK